MTDGAPDTPPVRSGPPARSGPPDAEGRPDIATVADALAGALTPAAGADLDALLAADPVARAVYARHAASLAATSRLLAAEPAPAMPPAVAEALDAAVRAAAADRRPVGATPVGPRRSGGSVRRYATNLALAAVVVGGLVLAGNQLARTGVSSSGSAAGSAATGAAAAATVPAPTPPSPAGQSRGSAPAPDGRPGPDAAVPGHPGPRAPRRFLSGGAAIQPGPTIPPGAAAGGPGVAALSAAQLPGAARALAADRTAAGTSCPSRPGARTELRRVGYAGAPAWLAVTAGGDVLLAELTRTVCGPALVTRTVPAR